MSNGLFLLRKIGELDKDATAFLQSKEFGRTYFEIDDLGTFVDDDFPRDSGIVADIMANTLGWTLFDSDFKPLATFSRLDKALNARDNSKVTVRTEIELDEDEDAEPTSQIGKAARRAAQA